MPMNARDTKDSIMVLADITDRELELLDFLIEQKMEELDVEDSPFIEVDGVALFSYAELSELWAKVESAQDRLDKKLAGLGITTQTFPEEEIIDLDKNDALWEQRSEYD